MLRILSAKIFREDLSDYALPMWAFSKFDNNIENVINSDGDTYKFCLPVSIGDFPETNVPACFSNDIEELRAFVNTQIDSCHRKAFIISDFQVNDLSNICFSGVISTSSKRGFGNFFDKSTIISITLKNPILAYGQEGISPRDLPADVQLIYDHVSNPLCGFPKIDIISEGFDLEKYKGIIFQAYMASIKIHKIAQLYDGLEYNEHTLFFVDNKYQIRLYEIVGEESFLGQATYDEAVIRRELSFLNSENSDKVIGSNITRKRNLNVNV